MRYQQTLRLSNREFKRLVGVQRHTFNEIVKALKDAVSHRQTLLLCEKTVFGRPGVGVFNVLARSRRRSASGEYRTYFHIANDWQVSEAFHTNSHLPRKVN